jgi:chromosome segregation ATPase
MKMTDANGRETVKEYEFSEKNSVKTEKFPTEEENKDKEIMNGRLNAFSANLEKYQSKLNSLEEANKYQSLDVQDLQNQIAEINENIGKLVASMENAYTSINELKKPTDDFTKMQKSVDNLTAAMTYVRSEIDELKAAPAKKISSKEAKT